MLKKLMLVIALSLGTSLNGAEPPLILNDGVGQPLDVVLPDTVEIIRFRPDPNARPPKKSKVSFFKRKQVPREVLISQSTTAEIVRIWDAEHQTVLQHFSNTKMPHKIDISSSGETYLSNPNSKDGSNLRESKSGRVVRRPEKNEKFVAFSEDGNFLYAVKSVPDNQQSLVRVFRTEDSSLAHQVSTFGGSELLFSPKGTHFLAADVREYDGGLYLWGQNSGNRLHRMEGVAGTEAESSLWSPDGKYYVKLLKDGLGVWDIANGKMLQHFPMPFQVRSVCFSPDGTQIAVGRGVMTIKIVSPQTCAILIDIPSRKTVRQFKTEEAYIDELNFSYNGQYLFASGRFTKGLYVWDLSR